MSSDFSVLRMAMALETDFRTFYSRAAEKTSSPAGKQILLMLADWEGGHQNMIEKQYQALQEEFRSEMGFEPF
ncbi:MAG: ferritin family protein [Synergistota bacterium]|nr:ferritin family protein [Synergistota bacterium]